MSQPQLTEEQRKNWVKEQFQKANKHLASKGIIAQRVLESESSYMIPLIALWKIEAQDKSRYWVISGDLPADHFDEASATDARDALRSFSLRWQMKAEQILSSNTQDNTQKEFAHMMINRAEGIYQVYEKDELWNS